MPCAPYHRLVAFAPLLACIAVNALAQGERPWVDPPVPVPASPPSPEHTPAPPAFDEAPVSRGKSLTLPPNQEVRPPVIQFGRRPPSTLKGSDAARETRSPSAERDADVNEGVRRLAARVTARPSFNCRGARSAVERAICADPVLAAKDQRMAILYEQTGGSRKGPVDSTQWRWLAARNACARPQSSALNACINQIYDARIAELSRARR
jgi:hypothetical protein